MNAADIEGIALKLANGATVLFPEAAPFVAVLEMLLDVADEYGIVPRELPSAQASAMAAAMAAIKSSAATSAMAANKRHTP